MVILTFGLYGLLIGTATNVVIFLVNSLLFKVMSSLSSYEKPESRVYEQESLLWKSLVAQFINSTMIYVTLYYIQKKPIWDADEGLIITGAYLIISGILYDIIIKSFNYSYRAKILMLWWKYRNGPLEQPKIQMRLN